MNPEIFVAEKVQDALVELYSEATKAIKVQVQPTRKEFEGDWTVVMFPYLRMSKKSPVATGEEVGEYLKENIEEIESFNVVKGFLNIKLKDSYWDSLFSEIAQTPNYGQAAPSGKTIMVEFSSPNTNKPLHLGHIRNNLLGWSVSQLLAANGHKVLKVNLVNDRGIHICKSMLAWKRYGNGETPESSGKKGDHLVGDYYVLFNTKYNEEVQKITAEKVAAGLSEKTAKEEAEKESPLLKEAQQMLKKWEDGDEEVRALWKKMNSWVYKGFDETYDSLGIKFDKIYHESETYLSGKSLVEEGLKKGIFFKKEDNSVWCDLEDDGLDQKLLLRGDGTSVYMTQDLGTAKKRYDEFKFDEHIYVVGNEQNYHFQVLKLILKKLGFTWSDYIYHLSYGMVELPEGKMKSREGTVVDADDLVKQMYETAKETSLELGKLEGMKKEEQDKLFHMIGMGALKYFIIKVDPKRTMMFNPKESIDFNGNTGPFIQYTHARIHSILRKAKELNAPKGKLFGEKILEKEISLIKLLNQFPSKIKEGGDAHSPAIIANYAYDLAKDYNQYYHDVSILKEEDIEVRGARLTLIETIAKVLTKAMGILGIELPERM
ncbi:MAG: arginine--tRNA ligase [Bacteroidales bacterium]